METHRTLPQLFQWLLLFVLFFFPVEFFGQTTVTYDSSSPGTGTWTVPVGVTSVTVEIWGAGGAGGGSNSNNQGGSGGGAGAYSRKIYTVVPLSNFTYTVGVAGVGVVGGAGLDGTASSATNAGVSIVADGGRGGEREKGAPGTGGTAVGGDLNFPGASGGMGGTGVNGTNAGGDGGDAPNGGSGGEGIEGGTGLFGANYGGGGGGGERAGGSAMAGGNGGSGAVSFTYIPPVVRVSGSGTAIADMDVTPDPTDWTDFETINNRQYEILNNTGTDITLNAVVISGADAADFSVQSFTAGTVVTAMGGTDYYEILFSPAIGCVDGTPKNATITITYDGATTHTYDIRATCYSATIDVTGNTNPVVDGAGLVDVSASNNTDFGNVPMNFLETRTFVINNGGTSPLQVNSVSVSGSPNFSVSSGAGAAIVTGNSTGSFAILYDPNELTTDSATVSVNTDLGVYSFVVAGTGTDNVIVPGCLGNPGDCNELADSSFDSNFTGWTFSGWTDAVENGYNAALFNQKTGDTGPGVHASMLQNLSGLDPNSSTLLVKFKVKVVVQPCNATGRRFDLNVKFGGTTYLTLNLLDTNLDASLSLQNGGILVATDLEEIRTWFSANGCANVNRVDDFTTIYLSIPKGVATTGDLEFTIENTGTTGATQFHQMDIFMGEVSATSNGGACGFTWFNAGSTGLNDAERVASWLDDSVSSNAATQTVDANRPTVEFNGASHFNFNPSLSFDGDDYLQGVDGYSSATQFVVFKHTSVSSGTPSMTLIGTRATDDNADRSGLKIGDFSSSISSELYGTLRGTTAAGYAVGGGSGTILNGILHSTIETVVSPAIPASWTIMRNGTEESRVTGGVGYQNWAESDFIIGASPTLADYSTVTDYFTGNIAEILIYASTLSTAETQKIQTYLAIKYGITLGHNYVSGAGNTIYDVSSYNNRIFGIGQESCQSLHQRQSQSQDDADTNEIMLTMGYNSIIGDTNSSANGNDVPDDSFVVIGDDNADRTAWTVSPDTAADAAVSLLIESERIDREFKVQVTGNPTSDVRIVLDAAKIPAIAGDERIAMVIAETPADIKNATFSGTPNLILPMTKNTDGSSIYVNDYMVDVDFSGYTTAYFTFIKYEDCYTELICSGTPTTWDGASWSNGTPDETTPVILAGAYDTAVNGNFSCCTLNLTTGILSIGSGDMVDVQHDITNNTSITIADGGDLLQYYDGAVNSGSGGVSLTRVSQPMYLGDYTYWSSPMSNYNLSGIPKNRSYIWNAQNGYWSYVVSGTMTPGTGYIVMTNNASKVTPVATTANFTGTINNGRILSNIFLVNSKWNLLGNPYPGALSAEEFILYNHAAGNTTGGLYFWTHNTRISNYNTEGLNGYFTETDYAVFTLAGGVGTGTGTVAVSIAVDNLDNEGLDISYGGNTFPPLNSIASGQAFFVEGLVNGTATFRNCMRVTSAGNNTNFYRSSKPTQNTGSDRFWIDVANQTGSFKRMLMGYFRGASDGFDNLYDANILSGSNQVEIYMLIDDAGSDQDRKLTIQGKKQFSKDDVIKVGFKLAETGGQLNVINLPKAEGIFVDMDIYLEDKLTQKIHNLKEGAYSFTSEAGEFNDRFVIRFTDKINNNDGDKKGHDSKESNVVVVSNGDDIIINVRKGELHKIKIHTVSGKVIYDQKKLDGVEYAISDIKAENNVLIVTVYLKEGKTETVKIIH